MSNTIKVIHMCDHVVPETEITTETNEFVTSGEVCQISTQPIHVIDRIEYFPVKVEVPAGKNALSVINRLKIDDFSYQEEMEYSEPTEFFKGMAFYNEQSPTLIRGVVNGMAFEDGFMFGKSAVSPHLQCVPTAGVMSIVYSEELSNKIEITGNGLSPTFSFKKNVYLTNFTSVQFFAMFVIPENCLSFSVKLNVPEWFDGIIFEKTNLVAPNEEEFITVFRKISIEGCDNFKRQVGDPDAYVQVSATFENESEASGSKVSMLFDLADIPCIISLAGTGYEHFSEEDLQYIFSDTKLRCHEFENFTQRQGRNIFFDLLPSISGQLIDQNIEIEEDYHWLKAIDPETAALIYDPLRAIVWVENIIPGVQYNIANNRSYGNVVYWMNSIGVCIEVSRGTLVTSPPNAAEAYITSEIGQGKTTGLRYRMALVGDIDKDILEGVNLADTKTEGLNLYGIPFGKKDFYDLGSAILSRKVALRSLSQDDIIDLYTGYAGCDVVTLIPFSNCATFETLEKEFKTFSWLAPEISAGSVSTLSVPSNYMYHYSDPGTGSIKILVQKGMAVNLTDAKIKLSGTYFLYEHDFPIETSNYKLMLEDMDFTRLGQNAIKWDIASQWTVDEGATLIATVETKQSLNRRYDEYSCPRCSGNGWYVSTTADASSSVQNVTGSDKMVQDFLKILLTDVRYYKPGTAFITLKGFVKRDQKIEDLIVLYIKDAETQLRQLQYNMSIAGSEISEYEELKTVIIESIDATSSQDRIYVEIRLVNMASEYTSIGLAV